MSETKRKIFIVIVLVLVILFGVGQFFSGVNLNTTNQPAQNQNVPVPTQVIAYAPPLLATSTAVENGYCFANSVAAPYRTDAWRCMVGNAISDPCFTLSSASETPANAKPQLLCGINPAGLDSSSTFLLSLTKPLPKPEIPSSTPSNWAWVVELSDGVICTPFTGTRPFSATGEVALYSCNGSLSGVRPGEDMIFGDLNNATTTWTAEVGSLSTATSTFPPAIIASATVPVFAVWQ